MFAVSSSELRGPPWHVGLDRCRPQATELDSDSSPPSRRSRRASRQRSRQDDDLLQMLEAHKNQQLAVSFGRGVVCTSAVAFVCTLVMYECTCLCLHACMYARMHACVHVCGVCLSTFDVGRVCTGEPFFLRRGTLPVFLVKGFKHVVRKWLEIGSQVLAAPGEPRTDAWTG